ncbi:GroES-like protein [Athelia psychrophila]|uniref:GroES-like protein n=1 Tax=Athelia psychrophila TaxID=1759441 RepID=A0A166PGC1_9AGAM|nr:GroES-like protein [Fibularhizoctonia sp. CBS 109695]
MTTQKALILPAAFSDFIIAPHPIPVPGPGDVLVRNEAVALNPVDRYLQKTPFGEQYLTFPTVIGTDFAGIVVKVGDGVTSLQEGDRVVANGNWGTGRGAFQEYTIATAKYASKLPTNVSFDEAASIPLTMITAAVGFYQKGAMGAGLRAPWEENGRGHYKGIPILITGGASSVGCFAIQLAKLSGFSPIYTTASPKHTVYLQSLGATHVIDRNEPLDVAAAALSGEKFTVIMDVITAGDSLRTTPLLLAPGGTLVLFRPAVEGLGPLPEGAKTKFVWGSPFHPDNGEVGEGLYGSLGKWLEDGDVKPNKVDILPGGFAGIEGGLQRLEARTAVIVVGHTNSVLPEQHLRSCIDHGEESVGNLSRGAVFLRYSASFLPLVLATNYQPLASLVHFDMFQSCKTTKLNGTESCFPGDSAGHIITAVLASITLGIRNLRPMETYHRYAMAS